MRVSAGRSAAEAAVKGRSLEQTNQYEIMLIQLAEDKRRLKEIQSFERKAELKAELLPEYAPYVDGVLESDAGVQDDVLMTLMVWRIDAGDLWGALEIGKYAMAHNLVTPEQYKRDTATLLAEEVADYALNKVLSQKETVNPELVLLTQQTTADHDMPDEVRSKLHKAVGVSVADMNHELALTHLNRALELNKNAGVKKLIERIERDRKKAEQEAAQDDTN
jgi:hypothetical protein